MKPIKHIAIFLAGLILLQSCSVYKTPVTLEQAAQQEKAVKILTVDDDTYKYKYIVYEDGQFYGVKDNPGKDVKFPVDKEEVTAVLMKKGFPWWAHVLIAAVAVTVVIFVIGASQVRADPGWT